MELRHIRYFLAVAREGNFTRAAAGLGIGQPPLSLQIRDLEREVGALLFRRSVHGAELTPAGKAFLEAVKDMPALAERGASLAKRASRGETGHLTVGFTASSAFNTVVPGTVKAFRHAYPGIDVSLFESNTTPLVASLADGRIDVAFLRPGDAIGENLHLSTVSRESLVLALPADHQAGREVEVDLAQLAQDPFILFSREVGPDLFDAITGVFHAAGINPQVHQLALQFSSILNFVAATLGVSIVPEPMSQLHIPGVVFRPIKGQSPHTFLALACQKANTSKLVRNFLSVAQRKCGRSGPRDVSAPSCMPVADPSDA